MFGSRLYTLTLMDTKKFPATKSLSCYNVFHQALLGLSFLEGVWEEAPFWAPFNMND